MTTRTTPVATGQGGPTAARLITTTSRPAETGSLVTTSERPEHTDRIGQIQRPPAAAAASAAGQGSTPLLPSQRGAVTRPRDLGDLVVQAAAAFTDYRADIDGGIDRLVRLVSPLLWHTARQCGLSTAEAEDAVQQTFLTLVRRGESIADPMAVVRWLTVTLRRQAWRDRAAVARGTGNEPTDDDLPSAASAEQAALLTDEQRRLWAHVSALPERCRRLLAVIAFSPRPDYAAIAADMGMPVGSIGPTRGRCLAKLRSRLQGEEW